jgi:hypothetical protein
VRTITSLLDDIDGVRRSMYGNEKLKLQRLRVLPLPASPRTSASFARCEVLL